MQDPVILWFRQDLRLADNPALSAAAASKRPIIALYILDDVTPGRWAMGAASRWWLAGSLVSLARSLAARGLRLILRQGEAGKVLEALAHESKAGAVYWNRCYEPAIVARDKKIKTRLLQTGIDALSFNAGLLHEPWTLKTGSGGSYKVFTPFHRALEKLGAPPAPMPLPEPLVGHREAVASEDMAGLRLLPGKPDWAGGLRQAWQPGEAPAKQLLQAFLQAPIAYGTGHDRPDMPGTSRLSPHMHWGEIGPRQIWHGVEAARAAGRISERDAAAFLRQVAWREFCHHLLFHFPALPERPWRSAFAEFPWRTNPAPLAAWQQGRTGYPIVDAGMRELWVTGWMHNRVRMIAASFLIKDLLQPWQAGEAWFWNTLVDADLAQNAANWQWVAGCGADAAPYFRIFNPVLQGKKFDPNGAYVRRWLPALRNLPDDFIHCPWQAPESVQASAKLRLGGDYPVPLVDHAKARTQALAAYGSMKNTD
jgi:deoxyribodipyrimidine photo-lyase